MTAARNERVLAAVRALAEAVREEAGDVVRDLRPQFDRVLVMPLTEDDFRTSNGLYLTQTGRKARYTRALVMSVGPGAVNLKTGGRVPMHVSPGDVVVVGYQVGELLEDQDVEYRLVREGDILATVHEEES